MKKILKALKELFTSKSSTVTLDDNLYKSKDDLGHC